LIIGTAPLPASRSSSRHVPDSVRHVLPQVSALTVGPAAGKRGKIPQIIRVKGLEPVIYAAGPDEYATRLRDKLTEEVGEFLDSDSDPEELADVLEVVYALAALAGTDPQRLEKLRAAKADERGGFADRIIWAGNQPAAAASS
jgi:predicted house-cleaning noncanonical NTP pyrophosphatase (MazG superfamily)